MPSMDMNTWNEILTLSNAPGVVLLSYATSCKRCVPDRPLVRVPIRTLLEYRYEVGVWDFDPVHILILIEV
jgi:hypothetical protein